MRSVSWQTAALSPSSRSYNVQSAERRVLCQCCCGQSSSNALEDSGADQAYQGRFDDPVAVDEVIVCWSCPRRALADSIFNKSRILVRFSDPGGRNRKLCDFLCAALGHQPLVYSAKLYIYSQSVAGISPQNCISCSQILKYATTSVGLTSTC